MLCLKHKVERLKSNSRGEMMGKMKKIHIVYILCLVLLLACIPLARIRAAIDSNSDQSSVVPIQATIEKKEAVNTGERQNVNILSSYSKVDTYETMYYRIDMTMDKSVSLETAFSEDGTYTVIQNGTQVVLHLSEDKSYIWYSLKAGETVSFGLDFSCPNGISGNYDKVELQIGVADSEEKIKNKQLESEPYDFSVAEWKAKFGWEPVDKSVNESYLKLEADNTLEKDLTYTIQAAPDDQGNVNTGRIWTETLVLKDTLNLPQGVTIPDGAIINGNRILNAAGEVLYEIDGLPEGSECKIELNQNNKITFTATVHNNEVQQKELENIKLTVHLATTKLIVASDYQAKDPNNTITNQVDLFADAYNSDDTASSTDQVETIITEKIPELVITKDGKPSNGGISVKAGDTIDYTITVKNEGTLEATEKTVVDTLPAALMLTEAQIAVIKNTGGQVTTNTEGNYVISWSNQTIPVNQSKTYTFQATVRDAKTLADLKVDNITNKASIDTLKVEHNTPYDKPELKVSKEHTEIGSIEDGSIIPYTITIKNNNDTTLIGVVATDTLPKGLVLLDDNGGEVTQSGTYTVGERRAIVTRNDDGTTMIVWELGDMEPGVKQISYNTKFVAANLGEATGYIKLKNIVNINYGASDEDIIGYEKVDVSPDKKIYDNDSEKDTSEIHEGQQVTYYLYLTNKSDNPITVNNVTDTLPNPHGSFTWNQENVVVTTQGTNADFCTYSSNKQTPYSMTLNKWEEAKIIWSEIIVPGNTTLKQEVKVTFPSDEAWEEYMKTLENNTWLKIENKLSFTGGKTIIVDHTVKDEDPQGDQEVYMQKGVYQLGQKVEEGYQNRLAYGSNLSYQGISRKYYARENGYVSYYFFVANTADTPITIKNAVDLLPLGVTYENMVTNYDFWHIGGDYENGISKDSIVTLSGSSSPNYTSVTGGTLNYKAVTVTANYDQNTNSILFAFSKDGQSVSLNKGEAICFVYNCTIDGELASDSGSVNNIAVPFEEDVTVSEKLDVTQNNRESSTKYPSNDGNCSKVSADHSGKYQAILEDGGTYYWLESKVTILPGKITPGLQKNATQYLEAGGTIYKTIKDDTSLSPSDKVKWEIIASNYEGLEDIKNYVITDSMQYPYLINKADITIYNRQKEKVLNTEEIAVPESNPSDNLTTKEPRNYTFQFEEDKYSIPSGGYAVLTIYTNQPNGLGVYSTFQNEATFRLSQDFTIFDVTDGEQGRDENGKIIITNRDTITVAGLNSTKSVKKITEKGDSANTASGNKSGDEKNYIVIPSVASTIKYTLEVTNTSSKPLTSFVVIDSLPDIGDTGLLDTYTKRGSEFQVNLADDPNMSVFIIDVDGNRLAVGNEDYHIEYSKEISYVDADWEGTEDMTRWSDEPNSSMRSIRVVLSDHVILYAGETIEVVFDATVSNTALPEQIAWNAFGYKYYTTIESKNDVTGESEYKKGTTSLAAAPPKVGVKLQGSANIQKIVLDSDGNQLKPDESKQFTFLIYQGKVSKEELSSHTPYKEITVTQGGMVSLSDYLEPNQYYTITELLEEDGDYKLIDLYQNSDAIKNTENCYQFYYTGEDSFTIIATNQKVEELCSIKIEKIDSQIGENGEAVYLPGATFMVERQKDDGTWEVVVEEAVTPENGIILFDKLKAGTYRITEIKAPSGYQKLQQPFIVKLPYSYQEGDIIQGVTVTESGVANDITITVSNAKVSILPVFGGRGIAYSLYLGLAITAMAVILIQSRANKKTMKKGEQE